MARRARRKDRRVKFEYEKNCVDIYLLFWVLKHGFQWLPARIKGWGVCAWHRVGLNRLFEPASVSAPWMDDDHKQAVADLLPGGERSSAAVMKRRGHVFLANSTVHQRCMLLYAREAGEVRRY